MSSIIKVSDKPVVTVAAYHESLYSAFSTGAKAVETMKSKGKALIVSKYADRFPSYNEWENDLAALKAIAERKSVDVQYYWKTYRLCMHEVFGALPVAMGDEPARKRAERMTPDATQAADKTRAEALAEGKGKEHAEALAVQAAKKTKTAPKQPNAGAPQGETKPQGASVAEAMEQYIAQFGAQGIFIALDAVTRILAAEKSTESKAKTLTSIRNQLARELKPAEQKQG